MTVTDPDVPDPLNDPRTLQADPGAYGQGEDLASDLISVQYHSLKAGHDYGQYVRDADNAGLQDIAAFFREVMEQDSARARRCHEFLRQISGTEQGGPATQ